MEKVDVCPECGAELVDGKCAAQCYKRADEMHELVINDETQINQAA